MAPPITEATQNARSNPDAVETAAAIGVSRVMVPTEVPIATDTKQATINSTDTENLAGIRPVSYTHLDVYKRQSSGSHCLFSRLLVLQIIPDIHSFLCTYVKIPFLNFVSDSLYIYSTDLLPT